MKKLIPVPDIEQHIYLIRGHKVMLDSDLAMLYGVSVKVLNQAVKRNRSHFPDDFMFQLTPEEQDLLRSQIVTLKNLGRGRHRKYQSYAFTEYGVSMLSSVLRSEQAVQVNILIMRTFGKLRGLLYAHKELAQRLEELERKYDAQFRVVFDAIRELMEKPVEELPKVKGFRHE